MGFWLIWFINQRALYNHALSIVVGIGIIVIGIVIVGVVCAHPTATGLDIETLYLVYICTYIPTYAHQICSDSDLEFLNGSHFGAFL